MVRGGIHCLRPFNCGIRLGLQCNGHLSAPEGGDRCYPATEASPRFFSSVGEMFSRPPKEGGTQSGR